VPPVNYAKGATMRNLRPILLVEDDNVDAMTVKRAFGELKIVNEFVRAVNGEAALTYLRGHLNDKPCVVLLDLNMPKMNGIEFLRVMKTDDELRQIPVVVLTTSKDDRDKIKSFKSHVAGYIVKPVDYRVFVKAMQIFDSYWTLSELPDSTPEDTAVELQKTDCTETGS
jgi:CheY-like chemotaxis protein